MLQTISAIKKKCSKSYSWLRSTFNNLICKSCCSNKLQGLNFELDIIYDTTYKELEGCLFLLSYSGTLEKFQLY